MVKLSRGGEGGGGEAALCPYVTLPRERKGGDTIIPSFSADQIN